MFRDLPPGLVDFLRDNVSSYEELNALLLLSRAPVRAWALAEAAESLNVPLELMKTALAALCASGILVEAAGESSKSYRYAPSGKLLAEQVAALQQAYVEQPMDVVQAMTANAIERVRSSAARRLADAFRFERSKK